MPDVPRDPRQLARDILAGKISIEDLAREQARRRGVPPPAPPKPMTRPAAIRQIPAASPPIQRIPTVRQGPVPPTRRPTIQPRPAAAPQRPVPQQVMPSRSSAAQVRPGSRTVTASARQPVRAAPAALPLQAMLRDPRNLARAIVLSEILGPPLALRDDMK